MTTDKIPYHSFDRVEKLKPGEVVPVEIDMYPTGLVLYEGESLRLKGLHVIHCGGEYDSYLQLPFKH